MKKIFLFILIGFSIINIKTVIAGYTLPDIIYKNTIIECTNTSQGALAFNSTTNALMPEPYFSCLNGNDTWENLFSIPINEMINVDQIVNWNGQDPPNCSQMTYNECLNDTSFISTQNIKFIDSNWEENQSFLTTVCTNNLGTPEITTCIYNGVLPYIFILSFIGLLFFSITLLTIKLMKKIL